MELIKTETIQHKIHTIREVQIILDKDLAQFYGVKPIRLREQIKRNPNRFPPDFVFPLSETEIEYMVSQNAIPSKQSLGGSFPLVFTEQGVGAVSGVIKSEKADQVSVAIARAFVAMRKTLGQLHGVIQRLEGVELTQLQTDSKVEQLLKAWEKDQPAKQGIFFEGQLFDAHVFASDLIKKANKSLVVIDNYVDEITLMLLSKRKKQISCTVHTRINPALKKDLEKHNQQYPEITLVENRSSHDRFIILDNIQLYHIGASLKDLGSKCFAFSRMDDVLPEITTKLLKR
jgi:hypothetical protein